MAPPAQPSDTLPAGVTTLFSDLARGLADQDETRVRAAFDPAMPNFQRIIGDVMLLVASGPTSSNIVVVGSQSGSANNDAEQTVQLDWLIRVGNNPPRRAIVNCKVALQDGNWRITALDPPDWFERK